MVTHQDLCELKGQRTGRALGVICRGHSPEVKRHLLWCHVNLWLGWDPPSLPHSDTHPSPLTSQRALGTQPPLPGIDDYFDQHSTPPPLLHFLPTAMKPIIDSSSFNFRQFPFVLRNLWLVKGVGWYWWQVVGKEAWKASKGMGFSWFSGSLEEIRTQNLLRTLRRSVKDSFHSEALWLLSSERIFLPSNSGTISQALWSSYVIFKFEQLTYVSCNNQL
jgi:hypothetical protein